LIPVKKEGKESERKAGEEILDSSQERQVKKEGKENDRKTKKRDRNP